MGLILSRKMSVLAAPAVSAWPIDADVLVWSTHLPALSVICELPAVVVPPQNAGHVPPNWYLNGTYGAAAFAATFSMQMPSARTAPVVIFAPDCGSVARMGLAVSAMTAMPNVK